MNENLKATFDSQGYAMVRKAFSQEEIAEFRRLVYLQFEEDKKNGLNFTLSNSNSRARYAKGDLLSKKHLRHILLDDRVLSLARAVLGSDNLVYFGDSSYQIGTGTRGFHRDSLDRTDMTGLDWQSDYTLIRLGIYLQNHKNYSGGLKVKPGTHLKSNGPAVFVDNETGDLVTWSLKLLHSGNAVKLKWFKNLAIETTAIENRIPSFLKIEEEQERISLFMTYAIPSAHVDRYIKEYEMKREDARTHIQSSKYDQQALDLARKKGVKVEVLYPEYQIA